MLRPPGTIEVRWEDGSKQKVPTFETSYSASYSTLNPSLPVYVRFGKRRGVALPASAMTLGLDRLDRGESVPEVARNPYDYHYHSDPEDGVEIVLEHLRSGDTACRGPRPMAEPGWYRILFYLHKEKPENDKEVPREK